MHKSIATMNVCRPIVLILVYSVAVCIYQAIDVNAQNGDGKEAARSNDECQVTPVIHVLQYPGCVPKPIPSFACIGRCSSYLQVRLLDRKMSGKNIQRYDHLNHDRSNFFVHF